MNSAIRILLVDDHLVIRESLRAAIDAQPGLQVIAEAGTCHRAIELAGRLAPDVLVLDLNLTDGNGWVVIEQLAAAKQLPPTLVLSVCEEAVFARRLLAAGARGYLMKDAPLPRVVQAIRDVHRGLFVASETICSRLMEEALGRQEAPVPEEQSGEAFGALSARELQICTMLATGLRNKEIARNLQVSEKTVATYKIRIMEKLGVDSTPRLIERCCSLGLGRAAAAQ